MRFPVTIAFAGPWRVHATISDADGRGLGYSPLAFKDNCLWIYSDASMGHPIYALKHDPVTRRHFALLDADGNALGQLEQTNDWNARYVVSVADEPRFEVSQRSPALHFVDSLFDPVPVVNVLTGMVFKPCHDVRRSAGGARAVTIVKQRTARDVSYVLEQEGELDARERECLLVASLLIATNARRWSSSPC